MEYVLSNAIESEATKIVCVSYTDERSAGGSSMEDMTIGYEHRAVGSNMSHLASAAKGDFVVVTAYNASKQRVFMVGVLGDAYPTCNLWQKEGGEVWKYNFHFTPITQILVLEKVYPVWKTICDQYRLNHHLIFNTRLCGHGQKYKKALAEAIASGCIPVNL
jgi:hypothetical protein